MAQIIKRRPQDQPYSYGVTPEKAQHTKNFNKKIRYVQGFRQLIAGSSTTNLNITLTSAGKFLLGITVVPILITDIADTQITFLVNNINLLNGVASENLNPNFTQTNLEYFPLPQPLQGNDNIQANFIKNDVGNVTVYINVFYLPQI
jgi:hypothetical protein